MALGWPELLEYLAQLCQSERAAEQARSLPLMHSVDAIERMLSLVSEACRLHELGSPLPLAPIADPRPALRRLQKEGTLAAATVLQITDIMGAIGTVRSHLVQHRAEAPQLATMAEKLHDLDYLWRPIRHAFEASGVLADHASADLGPLRRRAADLRERTVRRMKALIDTPHVAKHLQDTYYTQREDRYVLPVRTDAGPVVKGIVLGSSSSGATMFVEPEEVVELNNQLKVAQLKVDRETARILASMSAQIAQKLTAIDENLELITEIDLIDARARLAEAMSARAPRVSTDGTLFLQQLKHPLMLLSGAEVVPSDVELARGRVLVISGPNAGGKTVCLKGIGLAALMVRAGMHLSVGPDSHLPIYQLVLSDIGDDQSIEHSLSTFSGQLAQLLEFLDLSQQETMVLIDEVVPGTDPAEGSALAQALLEAFADRAGHVVVTTHYDRLKSMALHDDRFVNASVGFDIERWAPTFQLHVGVPGASFALSVARQLGMRPTIVARAESLIGQDHAQSTRLLEDLTQQQTRLVEQQRNADEACEAAQRAEQRYRLKLDELEQRGRRALTEAHAAALEELKAMRQQLRRLHLVLRTPERDDRAIDAELSDISWQLRQHEPKPSAPPTRRPGPGDLEPDAEVWVPSLSSLAHIAGPVRHGKVPVRVGSMRAEVNAEDVQIPTGPLPSDDERSPIAAHRTGPHREPEPVATPEHRNATDSPHGRRTLENTLDVRGMRVDEALSETDVYLDQALVAGRDIIWIQHGHGSGALRGAIRAHLALSPAVARTRPGTSEDGGDAVTAVWLR